MASVARENRNITARYTTILPEHWNTLKRRQYLLYIYVEIVFQCTLERAAKLTVCAAIRTALTEGVATHLNPLCTGGQENGFTARVAGAIVVAGAVLANP